MKRLLLFSAFVLTPALVSCTDNTAGGQTMAINYRLDMPIGQTCTSQ